MVQLLKMPRIDQAAIQEVVKWIGSLVDQETRRLSYRDTISRLSTVRASTELRQGRKVADIWSAFFVAPNSELWQLHRNLCLTQQISSEATEGNCILFVCVIPV